MFGEIHLVTFYERFGKHYLLDFIFWSDISVSATFLLCHCLGLLDMLVRIKENAKSLGYLVGLVVGKVQCSVLYMLMCSKRKVCFLYLPSQQLWEHIIT